MAIYLDANILWEWRTFDNVERLTLSIVAHQRGQAVFVPGVAAREAEETYRRSLETAVERHDTAVRELQRKFRTEFSVDVEPQPWIADVIDTWKEGLAALAEVIPTEPMDAAEALEREIADKPQKPGEGARDAAIWLTVLRTTNRLASLGSSSRRTPTTSRRVVNSSQLSLRSLRATNIR